MLEANKPSISLAFWPFVSLVACSPFSLFPCISSLLHLSLFPPLPPAGRTVTCNGLLNDFPAPRSSSTRRRDDLRRPVRQWLAGWLQATRLLSSSLSCMLCSSASASKQPSTASVHACMFDSILSTYLSVSVQARLSCGCLCESLLSRIDLQLSRATALCTSTTLPSRPAQLVVQYRHD